jgi:hypothetical protein
VPDKNYIKGTFVLHRLCVTVDLHCSITYANQSEQCNNQGATIEGSHYIRFLTVPVPHDWPLHNQRSRKIILTEDAANIFFPLAENASRLTKTLFVARRSITDFARQLEVTVDICQIK